MTFTSESDILFQLNNKKTRKQGFSMLVEKYQEPLYWNIRRMVISHEDTRDVLQETFIRVWKNLGNFKGNAKIYSWMYRIAINETFRFLEKKKRSPEEEIDLESMLLQKLESEPWINGTEAEMKLQRAILSLPPRQRQVFNMRYFGEMTYDEIAEVLNTSVESLKVNYHHSKKKIEALLKYDAI